MSTPQNRCSTCGGSDMNLVDGYYYCIECGTQDMTMQQTMLEVTTLPDGTYVTPMHKKKITQLKDNVQMDPEWHKWHTYNFILSGLADELIALGAKPSFKVKVLWIWTRYIKKYLQKIEDREEMEHHEKTDHEKMEEHEKLDHEKMEVSDDSSIQESEDYNEGKREMLGKDDSENEKEYEPGTHAYNTDLHIVTLGLFYAMCYIALNLDESDIQLSDLCRFIREEKVSRKNCLKFIPKGLDVCAIPKWENFKNSLKNLYISRTINYLSVILFKKLDLGSPKVPDFQKIIDKFITELCLPKDIKCIVLALAEEVKFTFCSNRKTAYVPDYEIMAMAYILMAMKLCFGLDDNYEIKLSDAVDKINNDESHIKSYKGICNETERLFSFREWYHYMELRKIILSKYSTNMALHNNQEVDDDLYVYEMKDRFKHNHSVKVRDKITMEILDKINPGVDEFIFFKIDCEGSLTPLTSYTEALLSYVNDPNLKLILSEDFSSYSINYITNGLDFRVENKNILNGVSKEGKIFEKQIEGNISLRPAGSSLTYVRNCENKNWLFTKPPKQEHITETKENINDAIDDLNDSKTLLESSESKDMSDIGNSSETSTVLEEDTDFNIFEDSFEDIKEENAIDQTNENLYEDSNINDLIENALEHSDNGSLDVSKSLNKNELIKALIEKKCQEFSIPLPNDMNPKLKLKRKTNSDRDGPKPRKFQNRSKVPVEMTIHDIISSYLTKLQNEFMSTLQESWRNTFDQSKLLENIDPQLNSNKIENDSNSVDETRRLSSCTNIENNDNDDVIMFNDDVNIGDQDLQPPDPKDNPDFDENVYETDQLYIKMKESKFEDVFLETDSRLLDILDKNEQVNRHTKKVETIRKTKLDIESAKETEELKPLINLKNNVKKYGYWVRYYANSLLGKNRFINQRFEDELDEFFPKSFTYVLRLCASILECSTLVLYMQLCRQEKLLKVKTKNK